MERSFKIVGANIVTPAEVIERGTVTVENGIIADVRRTVGMAGNNDVDGTGRWLLPGMIDTHSDAIEHEMQPRPASRFPVDWSFVELERKLAAQGITTMYHSFSMWDDNAANEARRNRSVMQYIEQIRRMNEMRRLIRNRVHIRFEITNLDAAPHIERLLQEKAIDQLSFMDHTPGQGQYRNKEVHKGFIMQRQKLSDAEAERLLEERLSRPKTNADTLQRLADLAWAQGIPLASHDDDSIGKLDAVEGWRAAISEFPVDLEVAVEAKRRQLFVAMGAPNVMLGRSHSNNLSALDAIREGAVDILCSDYYPPSMLQAVFLLHSLGYDLPYAAAFVSLNPARALGFADRLGSVEAGKAADLLLVDAAEAQAPTIERVWVDGALVCRMYYRPVGALAAN